MIYYLLRHLRNNSVGQGLVEYAFIIFSIALVVVASLVVFGDFVTGLFTEAFDAFP